MSFNIDKMISPFIKALPPSGLAKFLEITANNPKNLILIFQQKYVQPVSTV